MKILYGASNRFGAATQLNRFISLTSHEVKVAAHHHTTKCIPHVDWALDAIYTNSQKYTKDIEDIFGYKRIPLVRLDNVEKFIDDLLAWEPDLVISDNDAITAHIAKLLHIDLIYSSPVHLLDGIVWHRGQFKYLKLLEKYNKAFKQLPHSSVKLITSPFGVLSKQPRLKNKTFKWAKPYHIAAGLPRPEEGVLLVMPDEERKKRLVTLLKGMGSNFDVASPFDLDYADKLNAAEFCISSGESNIISDAIFGGKKLLIAPNRNDPEGLMNALLCEINGIGKNLGQVELAERSALNIIEKAFEWHFRNDHLPLRKGKFLHERIDECLM